MSSDPFVAPGDAAPATASSRFCGIPLEIVTQPPPGAEHPAELNDALYLLDDRRRAYAYYHVPADAPCRLRFGDRELPAFLLRSPRGLVSFENANTRALGRGSEELVCVGGDLLVPPRPAGMLLLLFQPRRPDQVLPASDHIYLLDAAYRCRALHRRSHDQEMSLQPPADIAFIVRSPHPMGSSWRDARDHYALICQPDGVVVPCCDQPTLFGLCRPTADAPAPPPAPAPAATPTSRAGPGLDHIYLLDANFRVQETRRYPAGQAATVEHGTWWYLYRCPSDLRPPDNPNTLPTAEDPAWLECSSADREVSVPAGRVVVYRCSHISYFAHFVRREVSRVRVLRRLQVNNGAVLRVGHLPHLSLEATHLVYTRHPQPLYFGLGEETGELLVVRGNEFPAPESLPLIRRLDWSALIRTPGQVADDSHIERDNLTPEERAALLTRDPVISSFPQERQGQHSEPQQQASLSLSTTPSLSPSALAEAWRVARQASDQSAAADAEANPLAVARDDFVPSQPFAVYYPADFSNARVSAPSLRINRDLLLTALRLLDRVDEALTGAPSVFAFPVGPIVWTAAAHVVPGPAVPGSGGHRRTLSSYLLELRRQDSDCRLLPVLYALQIPNPLPVRPAPAGPAPAGPAPAGPASALPLGPRRLRT